MMLNFLKRLFKHEKKKEEVLEENRVYCGMYCHDCGYAIVDLNQDEKTTICPNCGALLTPASFLLTKEGLKLVQAKPTSVEHQTGGHYRIRRRGPARSRHYGKIR